MSQQLRTWLLPLAMVAGGLAYPFFARLAFLMPYLIFCMLLITCCDLSPGELRFKRVYWTLLGIQVAGAAAVYVAAGAFSPLLGEGAMICVLAPTATAAAVITGMLGGSVAFTATYTLASSLCVAVVSPFFFAHAGALADLPFWESAGTVFRQVMPLLVAPLLCAFALERFLPAARRAVRRARVLSYYLWVISLTIVSGKTVSFIVSQGDKSLREEIGLALAALVACVAQFLLGRRVGRRHGDAVSAGQSLGQKNTVLAIWMAQAYLHPLASVAPAAYVLWQNSINSLQLWLRQRGKR
ncbi:MAG: transporter [Odoribacteraceae bacterium]|jgi:BASS family bile acid:Na+ symporter|nr:transporter [Odoribacteraceae bacterium]